MAGLGHRIRIHLDIDGQVYTVRLDQPVCIAIPLDFHGPQPATFFLPPATARAVEVGTFVGDTRLGGSCNCETVTFNPHGNGTHTEGIGHVLRRRRGVGRDLLDGFLPATLVTVTPEAALAGDMVVSQSSLEALAPTLDPRFLEALVIRTLPNEPAKQFENYSRLNPPYLSAGAMRVIRTLGVQHLLLDLPSADREQDAGALEAHRIFWDLPPRGRDNQEDIDNGRTITELIYVPNEVRDGRYLLNLQLPAFDLDAAPSRPLLYPVEAAL